MLYIIDNVGKYYMRIKLLNINYLWNIVKKLELNRQEKYIIGSDILKINTEKGK